MAQADVLEHRVKGVQAPPFVPLNEQERALLSTLEFRRATGSSLVPVQLQLVALYQIWSAGDDPAPSFAKGAALVEALLATHGAGPPVPEVPSVVTRWFIARGQYVRALPLLQTRLEEQRSALGAKSIATLPTLYEIGGLHEVSACLPRIPRALLTYAPFLPPRPSENGRTPGGAERLRRRVQRRCRRGQGHGRRAGTRASLCRHSLLRAYCCGAAWVGVTWRHGLVSPACVRACVQALGDNKKALELLGSALRLLAYSEDPQKSEEAAVRVAWARVLLRQGAGVEARFMLEDVLQTQKRLGGLVNEAIPETLCVLAETDMVRRRERGPALTALPCRRPATTAARCTRTAMPSKAPSRAWARATSRWACGSASGRCASSETSASRTRLRRCLRRAASSRRRWAGTTRSS